MTQSTTATGLQAFGPEAESFAASLPADLDLIVWDGSAHEEAYRDAVERRERGETFYVMPLLRTSWAARALALLEHKIGKQSLSELLRKVVRGEQKMDELLDDDGMCISVKMGLAVFDMAQLGVGLVVRSWVEAQRWLELIPHKPERFGRFALPDTTIPKSIARATPRGVVVWAPHMSAEQASLFDYALDEIGATVTIVCGSGKAPAGRRATYCGIERAREILAEARCVLVADHDDPGPALALAELGIPLAVPFSSGAHEYLNRAAIFNDLDSGDIRRAVVDASSMAPPVRRTLPPVEALRTAIADQLPRMTRGPLVSLIVPSYNRRHLLDRALRRLSAQIYQDIEIIIVNDGGEPVDDIVAHYPRSRLVNLPQNRGVEGALVAGFEASRGDYIGTFGDDDPPYPDHVSRLMEAITKTQMPMARSSILSRYLYLRPDGSYRLAGFSVGDWALTPEPWELVTGGAIGIGAFLIKREVIERIGYYLVGELPILTDVEFLMRLVKVSDFPHVRHVTAEGVSRGDESNLGYRFDSIMADTQRRVFEMHPDDRPFIIERRGKIIEKFEEVAATKGFGQMQHLRLHIKFDDK
ncbi:MAG TPA: glycosyltransferase family 2 protein [Candidatus Acidoferrales bacterium]|nr:glycosyltransferase family 2 protein [Candidatus Acidoferrales bacterium]